MDIHQRLILGALLCFALTVTVEWVTDGWVLGKWWWRLPPITSFYCSHPIYFCPSTPTLIAILLLIVALFFKHLKRENAKKMKFWAEVFKCADFAST